MTASNEFGSVLVWPLPQTAMVILRNYFVYFLPYTKKYYAIPPFPLCGIEVFCPAQMLEFDRQP